MRVAILRSKTETIVVGIDEHNNPIDSDGILFGPDSERDIEDFTVQHFINPERGEVFILQQSVWTGRV